MASVYALRLFIRAMHNRVGADVDSREICAARRRSCSCRSSAVILFLALYPQLALHRSEGSVKAAVAQRAGGRAASDAARRARRLNARAGAGVAAASRDAGERERMSSRAAALARHAHLKGPHVDFAALSPLIALLGGAVVVLLVGLLGSRWVRAQRRAGAQPRRARRGARA